MKCSEKSWKDIFSLVGHITVLTMACQSSSMPLNDLQT